MAARRRPLPGSWPPSRPPIAVISVAHHNPYGHPKMEVLDRLQDEHIRTFRTDAEGATSFYLNGSSVSAEPIAGK